GGRCTRIRSVYRRATIAVFLAAAISAAGLAPIFATSRTLPDCCTRHGCKMPKRVAKQCAFASCDQQSLASSVKMSPAIMVDNVSLFADTESPVAHRLTAEKLPPHRSDIDHPPRFAA